MSLIVCLGANALCFTIVVAAARRYTHPCCNYFSMFTALSGALGSFGMLGLFVNASANLRTQLMEKSFIAGVAGPKYQMGYSAYLCLSGSVVASFAMIPMFLVLRMMHEGESVD